MEKNELLEALKEHGQAIETKNAEFQKAVDAATKESKAEVEKLKTELSAMEETRKLMQKQLDELDIEIQKSKKEPSQKVKTFAAELKEGLQKEIEELRNFKNTGGKKGKTIEIELKSFLETADASITTGSLLPTPQFEVGISKAPDRMPYLLDIISTGFSNSLTIYWTQRKTRTDNSGFVTEGTQTTLAGGSVSESVLGYETKSTSMQNLLAFIKVSNNSIDDLDWLLSEVQTELLVLMGLKLDAAIFNGTVAVNGFDGIYTLASAFAAGGKTLKAGVTANNYDVLKFAIKQIRKAHFNPTHVVLNPDDALDMELERDDNGSYIWPPHLNVAPAIGRVQIIENTGVPTGYYLVGDFKKAKFWMRKGMDLKIWDQNEDDAEKMLKTITLYMRGTLVIKDADVNAFVKDSFADSITEITAV
jgi:HK97 family phage major capsid protein